jgi:hypothetical protein
MIAAGRSLGREVIVLKCRSAEDFEAAFATLVERAAGALVVSAFPDAALTAAREYPQIDQFGTAFTERWVYQDGH